MIGRGELGVEVPFMSFRAAEIVITNAAARKRVITGTRCSNHDTHPRRIEQNFDVAMLSTRDESVKLSGNQLG
jgi:hypothetical protein